ncbi:prolyl 4-hydroxylase subunit alpha-1 isoform X1 [Aedes aegypti]|uniref:procollagen-proline 4-dioxygenase n=2 Tax=Aedes aegypti TaxID=7159 RepID=A0A6I8T8A1_AEDAE|nr:prolyl 4-hydroxylase subunit alpha-1 isoform X1 [Aedes aegypti]
MFCVMLHCILLLIVSPVVQSEVYSALSDLDKLIKTEDAALKELDIYIREQEKRMIELRRRAKRMNAGHIEALENAKEYLFNPVNAFLLIKRLTIELNDIELITKDISEHILMSVSDEKPQEFPSLEDLEGAMNALIRLQDVYNLDTSVIANGIGSTGSKMLSDDCFELGQHLQQIGDTHGAAKWYKEAYNRFTLGKTSLRQKVKILEYLASYTYTIGKVEEALAYISELHHLVPDHESTLHQKTFYEDILWYQQEQLFRSNRIPSSKASMSSLTTFKKLCRGEIQRNVSETSHLKCRYVSNLSAFSKIGPFKLEEMHLKPKIVIFHDVLSDTEIELLKRLAKPILERATIANQQTGKAERSKDRVSKSSWFPDEYHSTIRTITKRVADMTGLSMDTAEELQVVNYGLGGQYDPHFDFFHWGKLKEVNRIATVLFYMSDVSIGGATVFPKLGVTLEARKGTAAFWYNLHSSGELDYSTLHGACPVLIGEKWVANKWIRERGQEFRRKCDPKDLE